MVVVLLLRPLLSRSSLVGCRSSASRKCAKTALPPPSHAIRIPSHAVQQRASASVPAMAVLNDLSLRHLRAGEGHMECPLSAMYAAVREEYCSGRRADLC